MRGLTKRSPHALQSTSRQVRIVKRGVTALPPHRAHDTAIRSTLVLATMAAR